MEALAYPPGRNYSCGSARDSHPTSSQNIKEQLLTIDTILAVKPLIIIDMLPRFWRRRHIGINYQAMIHV